MILETFACFLFLEIIATQKKKYYKTSKLLGWLDKKAIGLFFLRFTQNRIVMADVSNANVTRHVPMKEIEELNKYKEIIPEATVGFLDPILLSCQWMH